ncbi:DNA polymerase III subunit gamma/tau [candidate division Kazan bacterium]|uniref:DNA polymerase III subunit gamma/tau n=1 Tax=candidate division Kazan bacterium TaxID=2202143 RepID=A0A420ZD74_UNCK3|nr:MAG: DNA polymerase III subunit gamma/tau [candidate division Kazan bacterium]
MQQAWYRKYRPQTFGEVVGQAQIKTTLLNQIKLGKVAHAYLFAGPRGTGKTSLARILARAVNCLEPNQGEPCGKCQNCLSQAKGQMIDLIEIDAASHTGVDNIRELIDKLNLAPAICKYKVYVIDEVHMLSKGAFNALLKTLEEPPSHVIFVLATTELHRVPATIISRCQRYDFKYLTTKDIATWLSKIAKQENVKIDEPAITFLAEQAGGSGRDGLSLLEQVANMGDDITREKLASWLGFVDWRTVLELAELVVAGKAKAAIQLINKIYYDGYDLAQLTQAWISLTRQLLATKLNNQDTLGIGDEQLEKLSNLAANLTVDQISWWLRELMDSAAVIKRASIPQVPLEILVIRAVRELGEKNKDEKSDRGTKTGSRQSVGAKPTSASGASAVSKFQAGDWAKVVERICQSNPTLGAVLAKTKIEVAGNLIKIKFSKEFYKDAAERPNNIKLLEKVLSSFDKNCTIECLVDASVESKAEATAVDRIVQVFGKA